MKLNKLLALVTLLVACLTLPVLAADAPRSAQKIDEQCLAGRWVRPDGGYVIDIRKVQADGTLDAAYFNPDAIRVSRAEWKKENESLLVFIELRDTNYPGATYKLRYYTASGQLAGEYFQPLLQETFDVYFIRQTGSNKKAENLKAEAVHKKVLSY